MKLRLLEMCDQGGGPCALFHAHLVKVFCSVCAFFLPTFLCEDGRVSFFVFEEGVLVEGEEAMQEEVERGLLAEAVPLQSLPAHE